MDNPQKTTTRAATLLFAEAKALKDSHTIPPGGKWDEDDITAKAGYDEMVSTARALRRLKFKRARGGFWLA